MTDLLRAVDQASLVRFLVKQRWFSAREADIASAALHAVTPLPDADAALACVRVELNDRSVTEYQVPLAVRDHPADDDRSTLTRVGARAVVDALADPEFLRRITRAFNNFNNNHQHHGHESFAGAEAVWTFTALGELPDLDPPRPVTSEQSNSSVVLGERAILKFYRRLAAGEHPDVEVARALTTRTSFRGTPPLLGVAHLQPLPPAARPPARTPADRSHLSPEPADRSHAPAQRSAASPPAHLSHTPSDLSPEPARTVVAALYQYIPDAADGWVHVLARLRADGDPGPDLSALGAVTRDLHVALASIADDPAFAPEPTTAADLEHWQDATVARARAALARLSERRATLPVALAAMTQRVLARADELVARVRVALDPGGIGPKIRHHGDYHLGQTLHTPDGWRILDFEGEPTRPLAERRIKHHPLRDVAGMLRSLAYAAAVAGIPAAEPRMRAAFLAGYDPTLHDDPRRADLLALFTGEKLFYELDYELGHRPDWVRIPLAAIAAMLPADPA